MFVLSFHNTAWDSTFCSKILIILHTSVSIRAIFTSHVTVTVRKSNRNSRHQGGQIFQTVVITFSLYWMNDYDQSRSWSSQLVVEDNAENRRNDYAEVDCTSQRCNLRNLPIHRGRYSLRPALPSGRSFRLLCSSLHKARIRCNVAYRLYIRYIYVSHQIQFAN